MNVRTLALSFLLVGAGIAGPSIAPEEISSIPAVVRFTKALPAMEGQAFENKQLTIGHSRVVFESGHAAPLLVGDESAGMFFVGKGYLEYTSKEPSEFAVLDFNLNSISGPKSSGGGAYKTIRIRFEELSLFAHGWDLPEVSRQTPRDLLATFRDHHSYLQRLEGSSLVHSLVMGSMNSPVKPVALLQISGRDGNWVYHYDSANLQEERLLAGRPVDRDFEEARVATISCQPIGWAFRKGKEAPLTLTDVQMEITTENQRDVRIDVEETLIPAKEGMKALHLELVSKLFSRLGQGIEWRHLRVLGVMDVHGKSIPFHHHHDSLLLLLTEPLPAGIPAKFRFQLGGDILVQPNGDNYWSLTTFAWFPQPDWGGQYYTVRCKMKVRKPFIPIASGDWVRRAEEGNYNILESEIKKPVQFFTVIAGKYTIDEKTENGLTVRAASYALVGTNGKNLVNLAHEMIRHYQTLLGPFPFKEYNIVQINSWGWGQAPPGLMLITNEAFTRSPTLERRYFSKDINARFAHEIAHAYWGHVVKMASSEEQWITEAFSEYSSALMIRIARGEGYYEKMVGQLAFDGEDSTKWASIPSANLLFSPDYVTARRYRQNLLYSKGAYLLHCLHKELGEKQFIIFLRSYQASFRWKFGSTDHIVGLLNYITKKDYSPFFEKYFWGVGFPPPPKP